MLSGVVVCEVILGKVEIGKRRRRLHVLDVLLQSLAGLIKLDASVFARFGGRAYHHCKDKDGDGQRRNYY